MHDLDEIASLATELARSAGGILLEEWSRPQHVGRKSTPTDVVTQADGRSEEFLVEQLRRRRPDDAILAEEGHTDRGTSGVRWVLDPLDGTVNFIYGIPNFAVSIGVEIDDQRTIGVVFNPAGDELFHAIKGHGATLNGRRISATSENDLSQALVATGFAYSSETRARSAQMLSRVLPATRDIRRIGSASLDLCAVACGRVDAYYEESVNEWDVAAGDIIAIEAGARVEGITRDRANKDVLAANPALFEGLRDLLNSD